MGLIVLVKVPGAPVGPEGADGYGVEALTCFSNHFIWSTTGRDFQEGLLMRGTQGSRRGGVVGGDRFSAQVQWKPLENLLEGGCTQ